MAVLSLHLFKIISITKIPSQSHLKFETKNPNKKNMGNKINRPIIFSHLVTYLNSSENILKSSRSENSEDKRQLISLKILIPELKPETESSEEESENTDSESYESDSEDIPIKNLSHDSLKRVRISEDIDVSNQVSNHDAFRKHSREFDKQEFTNAIKLMKKQVEIIDEPEHKKTSKQFRRLSHEFESGEFTLAKNFAAEHPIIEEDNQNEKKVIFPNLLEVPQSNPLFVGRSKEFERNEYGKAKQLSMKEIVIDEIPDSHQIPSTRTNHRSLTSI